tara:strand:+ start:19664 stop:20782 length:1119 start_codon:yes stop_codon:yes gene_type:complete
LQNYDYDFIFAYQESLNCKLITSKHRIVNYFLNKKYNVLYIELPLFLPNWILKKIFSLFENNYNSRYKNIKVIRPFTVFPTKLIFDNKFFSRLESFIVSIYIQMVLGKRSISCRYFQIYIPKAIELFTRKYIYTKNIYYHLIDDFRFLKRAPKVLDYYHKLSLTISTKIFTPSKSVLRKINSEKVYFLPHGYISYNFKENKLNTKNIISERYVNIIYYGQLNKLNYELINEVILNSEQANFLFVGNIGQSNIISRENVKKIYFLNHKDLMFILKSCQLLWCPFEQNKLNFSMTPIKFTEALSFGIPVLSTNINFEDPLIKDLIDFRDKAIEHIEYIQNIKYRENSLNLTNKIKERSWDSILDKFNETIIVDT